jgi:hypothetical protein
MTMDERRLDVGRMQTRAKECQRVALMCIEDVETFTFEAHVPNGCLEHVRQSLFFTIISAMKESPKLASNLLVIAVPAFIMMVTYDPVLRNDSRVERMLGEISPLDFTSDSEEWASSMPKVRQFIQAITNMDTESVWRQQTIELSRRSDIGAGIKRSKATDKRQGRPTYLA